MAGKPETHPTDGLTVRVRLGEPVLEAGYTLVPNLLLDHYETLGLNDGTAIFVIRLLRQIKSGSDALPDYPQAREHLQALHESGLLSVRRWPDRVELGLDLLFHNLARLAGWLDEGSSPGDFQLEIPVKVTPQDDPLAECFDSAEFEAEVTDVLAAFAAANRRAASPSEKEQLRNLAVRFDVAARAAAEPSNGPAWVMAALRSVLESKRGDQIFVPDLEQALEERLSETVSVEPSGQADKEARRKLVARIKKMGVQQKEALETVIMAYQRVAGQPAQDRLTLVLVELSDEYGAAWVVNAIHETAKVQQLISPEYIESILIRWRSEGRMSESPVAASSASITDGLLVKVMALYQQEIEMDQPLTPAIRDQLLALTDEFRDLAEWQRAFAETAKSNARSLRYVEAVLRKQGKKPAPKNKRRASSPRRRKAGRVGVWTEEELDAARRESLSETPIDLESFLGKEA